MLNDEYFRQNNRPAGWGLTEPNHYGATAARGKAEISDTDAAVLILVPTAAMIQDAGHPSIPHAVLDFESKGL